MKWPFRHRKERRLPENAERRENWTVEPAVTDPAFREAAAASVARTLARAREVANIAAVVTIRTKPKSG